MKVITSKTNLTARRIRINFENLCGSKHYHHRMTTKEPLLNRITMNKEKTFPLKLASTIEANDLSCTTLRSSSSEPSFSNKVEANLFPWQMKTCWSSSDSQGHIEGEIIRLKEMAPVRTIEALMNSGQHSKKQTANLQLQSKEKSLMRKPKAKRDQTVVIEYQDRWNRTSRGRQYGYSKEGHKRPPKKHRNPRRTAASKSKTPTTDVIMPSCSPRTYKMGKLPRKEMRSINTIIVRQSQRTESSRTPMAPGTTKRWSVQADGRGERERKNWLKQELSMKNGREKVHTCAKIPILQKFKSTISTRQISNRFYGDGTSNK